jgi:2-oxopent-4-enoate/cis-2-oxohex-4-enoate hydratase
MPRFENVGLTHPRLEDQDPGTRWPTTSCGVVLGDNAVDPRRVDLSTCGMVLEKNDHRHHAGAAASLTGQRGGVAGQHRWAA